MLWMALVAAAMGWSSWLHGQAQTETHVARPGDTLRVTNVEIVDGEPFGVGKVTFEPAADESLLELTDGFQLTDADNRVLYPVVSQRFIDKVLDATEPLGVAVPSRLTFWFLVRGKEKLRLRIAGNETVEFEANVQVLRPNATRRLVRQWWREYSAEASKRTEAGELPPLVESYMVAMLSQRLGFEAQRLAWSASRRDPLRQTMDLVFDTESLKSDLVFELMTAGLPQTTQVQPLPDPIVWDGPPQARDGEPIVVEPLATVVPAECFYLRFGNWQNQLWLKSLMSEYGGDLSRMVQLRGYKSPGSDRMLNQLALEPTKLDDLLGGNVIEDMALVGTDTYVADGASIGILFQSKNDLFKKNLDGRREQFAKDRAQQGIVLQEVRILDQPVTLLISPDNSVRSFFVTHDRFHLVTTSETLAGRFLQAATGDRSLAGEASFRNARRIHPVDRQHTIFLFVSESFFHNLLSPKYQIELRRRGIAQAARNVWRCATLAAAREGFDPKNAAEMIQAGFLPASFQIAADQPNSPPYVVIAPEFSAQPGLPVADVVIERVSEAEAEWFTRRATYFAEKIGRFDPLTIAIKRYAVDEQRERLAIDARIAPFAPYKYDWMGRFLGPATADQLVGGDNDVASLQVSLQQDMLGLERSSAFYQLFAAIQNEPVTPNLSAPRGLLNTLRMLKQIPGYVVAWPNPAILNSLPLGFRGRPDEEGFTYSRLLDLWRMEFKDFAALSFDRERLLAARDLWRTVPGERMAQARLRIGDVSQSQLKALANAYFYWQAWDSSLANVRLVNQIAQQFGVSPEVAWQDAEQMLDVKLVCPLEGQYELRQVSPSRQLWCSTAWPEGDASQVPPNYQAAIFLWFRGLAMDVVQTDDQFVVHAIMDVQRQTAANDSPLPSFDLFKGFEKIGSIGEYLLTEPKAEQDKVKEAPKRP